MTHIACVCLLLSCATMLSAAEAFPPEQATVETKREWLRERLVGALTSVRSIRETHARLDRMDEAQLDALIARYRDQMAGTRGAAVPSRDASPEELQRLQELQAYRDRLVAEYQQRLAAARGGRPGFAPVITTLPSGTSLSASATISPDRRYVRINATPFFSQVDGYRLFNLNTGAYSPLIPVQPYGYGGVPRGGYNPPIPYAWPIR